MSAMPPPNAMEQCVGCHADVVWIRTIAGKMMICNPRVLTVVTDEGQTIRGREPHWGSCPARDRFKKAKEPKPQSTEEQPK